MSDCKGGPMEEYAERYLTGKLTESEAEHFEEHYFGCNTCHELLSALKQVQAGLAREPIDVSAPQPMRIVARNNRSGSILGAPLSVVVWGSLAAALIVGAVLLATVFYRGHLSSKTANQAGNTMKPSPSSAKSGAGSETQQAATVPAVKNDESDSPTEPDTQLAMLADQRLPGYQAPQLRSPDTTDKQHLNFIEGMQRYAADDCPGTLAYLGRIGKNSSDALSVDLYSGLCQFKSGNLNSAQKDFETIVATGDSAQLETAEYYLAQTMLRRSDAANAAKWLTRTMALHGDYEERAKAQLSKLR